MYPSLGVDLAAVLEGEVEQGDVVADLAGGDQVRARLGLVFDIHVSARLDEHADDLDVVAVGGRAEVGRARCVMRLDFGTALEQRAHRVAIAAARRFDQPRAQRRFRFGVFTTAGA